MSSEAPTITTIIPDPLLAVLQRLSDYEIKFESWTKVDHSEAIEASVLRKYSELTPPDAIQADCDVKATNIILQGLPPKVYALVSNHRIANKLWERIQLLMQ
ncbi:hypothetical protein Tco_1422472 [Tanacetum coccineum]